MLILNDTCDLCWETILQRAESEKFVLWFYFKMTMMDSYKMKVYCMHLFPEQSQLQVSSPAKFDGG